MASKGNTTLNKGIPTIKDAFIVIVKTEWNEPIVSKLLKAVKKVCKNNQIKLLEITVPGAVEIPFAVKQHYTYANQIPDAYITLGAVIKGGTPHFDYVCKSITEGILQLNLTLDVPTIFGVLTLDNEEQAKERTGGKHGNKGEEFANTAIKMIAFNRSTR